MKKTQIDRVKDRLKSHGQISRNECLKNYISRLAAIIQVLEDEGYEFETVEKNGDYVYIVKHIPVKQGKFNL